MMSLFRRFTAVSVLLALSLCWLYAQGIERDDVRYIDASTLTVIGKFKPTDHPFHRIDGFDFKESGINRKCAHSTGLAVVFKTNSSFIRAKWTTGDACPANMTAIGQKGLDLYIKSNGQWCFAGVGSPVMKEPFRNHSGTVVNNMPLGEKECLLYLPLYDYVDTLFLGIDPQAYIEPIGNPFRHRIVFGGSSITHGASASRPGMCFTSLLEQKYGLHCMNLGFSGNFKLQKAFAQYCATLQDIDAFVFDAFSNPSAQQIEERFAEFMDIIREAHPFTPVIFLQTETRESRNFNLHNEEVENAKQLAAEKCVRERMLSDPNLYFIDSEGFLPIPNYSTTDGTHPNDYAMIRTVDIIAPHIIRTIEKKYDPRVERLVAAMTLEEKIGQLNLISTKGDITGPTGGKDPRDDIRAGRCGNVLNAVGLEYVSMLQKIAVEESRLGIPLLFGYDEIHGQKTIFPICLAESCSWDLDLIENSARIAASEAAAQGVNWTYNPMVDICWDPRWGRVSEGAGEDPWYGAKVAEARVRGVQGDDLADPLTIAACVKHYAAYGAAEAGRDYNTVDMSEHRFREFYLPPYKGAVDAGVRSVMTSFNEFNGIPSTGNDFLINKVLRGELGFDGVVVTDASSLGEMVVHGYTEDKAQAAVQAIKAGVDMDMSSSSYISHLADKVRDGEVSVTLVNDAVRRVLQLKCDLGLFDDPYRYINPARERKLLYSKDHLKAALRQARASMVLLKNEGEALPLKKGEKIALIGELATGSRHYLGSWIGKGEASRTETVAEVFARQAGAKNVVCVKGCSLDGQEEDNFDEAIAAGRDADKIVLMMGEPYSWSGEANCRTDIRIPDNQVALLEKLCTLGKPVIVVLMNGRALDLTRESALASAILECWYPGSMAAEALFDVMYGRYNPSGHLTVSFPRSAGQLPYSYCGKNTGRPYGIKKSRFTSHYLDCDNSPLYPFGSGLSYTEFSYSPIRLSADTMTVDGTVEAGVTVTNVGKIEGTALVQLYLRDMVGSVTRPVKMLRGFEKVTLAPGESRNVKFVIDEQMLKFFRADMTYGSEPGTFRIFIGPDASVEEYVEFRLK